MLNYSGLAWQNWCKVNTPLLQHLLSNCADVVFLLDNEGRFTAINDAVALHWGYSPVALAGKHYSQLVYPADKSIFETHLQTLNATTHLTTFASRIITKDGDLLNIKWELKYDANNQMTAGIATAAASKKEEQTNRGTDDKVYRAYKLSKTGWWEWDVVNNRYFAADELYRIYGLSKSDYPTISLQQFLAFVHPEDLPRLQEHIANIPNLSTAEYAHRFIKPGGEIIHVQHLVEVEKDDDGQVLRLNGTTKDVTAEVNAAMALAASNERYEFVAQATSDAIYDCDILKRRISFSQVYNTMFGYKHTEKSTDEVWKNILQKDRIRVQKQLEKVLGDPLLTTWKSEYRLRKANGAIAYVLDRGFIIRNNKGEAVRLVGCMQDISKQKEIESSLKLSEYQFRILFNESPKPKCIVNRDTLKFTEVNDAAIHLYGFSRQEFLQLTILDIAPEEDHAEILALRKNMPARFQKLVRHVKKSGQVFYINICGYPIHLPNGPHLIIDGDDMTDKLQLQQKLIEEKVAVQKEISKAIIDTQEKERSEMGKELHDNVNQLLTTAKLYIENIKYFPEQRDAFVDKSVCLLLKSIREIRFLSRQLVTPVINEMNFETSVIELLDHYITMQIFEIELHYDVCERLLNKGLKLTLHRILQEQLNNIVKYAKASLVKVRITLDEDHLLLTISDNGAGFEKEKIVMGLGLNNIKNRAEIFKGQVEIDAAPGKGCCLHIAFPSLYLMQQNRKATG